MEEKTTQPLETPERAGFDKTKLFVPAAIVIASLVISGTIFFSQNRGGTANIGGSVKTGGQTQKVSEDNDAFLGPKNAKVALVEFSDFQCPFCRRFWKETLPQLKKNFIDTGKIKFVYRDFPLDFHPSAMPAAQAAECAGEQGKFWEFHDKIFQEQDRRGTGTVQFNVSDIKKWAAELGLGPDKFNNCLDSGKYEEEVKKDYADGSGYGVSGTPTVFVNGDPIIGAQPYEIFKAAIERALNK